MADTTIDLLKNSSYVGKMDELIAAVKSGGGTASDVEWDNVKNKPTTIGGYGIIDAKIDNGTITLGNQTITPLTSAPVTSVNSKTGAVVLNASDVGALPADTVIPTVNNATLTIRRNSVDVGSFTANSAEDVNIDINVPTDKSDIGLGNVDNVKQYSATNPPPYPVTSVNGATGDVKSTFYVTVTQGDNNTATADKTAEEVYAAYAAGYAVYAIVNLKPDIGYSLVAPMVIGFKQSNQVALAFITLSGFQFMEVQYIMSAWSVTIGTLANSDDIPTIPEYLPNPNALTFTGAVTGSYDGSAPLSVEIPSGGGGETPIDTISEGTLSEDVANIVIDGFSKRTIALSVVPYGSTANSGNIRISLKFGLDSGDVLTCNPSFNFVTNTASVAWNKIVVFAFIENGIIEATIYRDGGTVSQDIYINGATSQNTWLVKSIYIDAKKITSVTIGLQSDGVIGKNTAYKVVGS